MFNRLGPDELDPDRLLAELGMLVHSEAGAKILVEDYVGLPFEGFLCNGALPPSVNFSLVPAVER